MTQRPAPTGLPVEVIFRNMEPHDAIAERIRHQAASLRALQVVRCRLSIAAAHRFGATVYDVAFEAEMVGGELIASPESDPSHALQDLDMSIAQAFSAVLRCLKEREALARAHGGRSPVDFSD